MVPLIGFLVLVIDLYIWVVIASAMAMKGMKTEMRAAKEKIRGTLDIDPATRALTAGLWDVTGKRLWSDGGYIASSRRTRRIANIKCGHQRYSKSSLNEHVNASPTSFG